MPKIHVLVTDENDDVEVESSGTILIRHCGDHFHPSIQTGGKTLHCATPFPTPEAAVQAGRDFLAAAGHGDTEIGPIIRTGEGLPN